MISPSLDSFQTLPQNSLLCLAIPFTTAHSKFWFNFFNSGALPFFLLYITLPKASQINLFIAWPNCIMEYIPYLLPMVTKTVASNTWDLVSCGAISQLRSDLRTCRNVSLRHQKKTTITSYARVVSQWSNNDVQWSLTSQWPHNGLWSLSAPAFLCLLSFFAWRLEASRLIVLCSR